MKSALAESRTFSLSPKSRSVLSDYEKPVTPQRLYFVSEYITAHRSPNGTEDKSIATSKSALLTTGELLPQPIRPRLRRSPAIRNRDKCLERRLETHSHSPIGDCSLPKIDYREYRSEHILNKRSPQPKCARFYKPQVVRLTSRSRMVLHSATPLPLPRQVAETAKKPTPKPPLPALPVPQSPAPRDLDC